MNLAAKYNRTELIRDGDIQAWKGVERSTGEAVVLYLYTGNLAGGQSLGEAAKDALAQSLSAGEAAVDGGVFGLSPCVVAREAKASVAASAPPKAPEPPRFSAPPPSMPPVTPGPDLAVAQPATTAPPDGAPGEFTAMFGAAMASEAAPVAAQAAPAPQAPEPAPAPPSDAGGKGAVSAPAEPPESAKAAAPPHPGVFTNLFMAAGPAAGEPVSEAPAPAEPAKPAPPPNPGIFTSLYMAADPAISADPGVTPESSVSAPSSTPQEPVSVPEPEATPEPEIVAEPAATPGPEAGVFTSLFMAASPGETSAPAIAETSAPEPPAVAQAAAAPVEAAPLEAIPEPAAAPEPEAEEPGEFTMAFGVAGFSRSDLEHTPSEEVTQALPVSPAPDGAAAASAQPEAVVESSAAPLEEVLSLKDTEPAADAPDVEVHAAPEDLPGEFTRLFDAAPVEADSVAGAVESTDAMPAPAPEEAAAAEPAPVESPAEFAAGSEEAERYSSASPAKGPIRFAAGEKPAADETPKQSRSPLSSGSFSQTYVSTGEMPVMRESILGVPAAAPPAGPVPAAEGSEAPGEFTMLFASPGGAVDPGAPSAVPPSPAGQPAPEPQPVDEAEPSRSAPATPVTPPAAAQGDAPGEFTRFFQQGDVDKIKEEVAAMSASASPAPGEAKPAQEQPAGEFTRMFSAAEALSRVEKPKDPGVFTSLYIAANPDQPEAAAPAASAPPPVFTTPAPSSGGTFTNLFRAAEGGIVPSEPVPAPADDFMPPASGGLSLPQSSSISEEPSFTRYFQAGDLPAAPSTPQEPEVTAPSPDLPAYSSGYSKGATSFFQAVPEPAAPEAQAPEGPGEYTRMISGAELQQAMEGGSGPAGGGAPAGPAAGGGGASVNIPLSTPHVSSPYVQGPRMSGPYVSGPQISGSGISAPQVQGPHFSGPQMSGPHVQGPHMSTPHVQVSSVQTPPIQTGGGAPVTPGQAVAPGGGASKIIIVATVLVTVIAVVLVLLVAYFMLKP